MNGKALAHRFFAGAKQKLLFIFRLFPKVHHESPAVHRCPIEEQRLMEELWYTHQQLTCNLDWKDNGEMSKSVWASWKQFEPTENCIWLQLAWDKGRCWDVVVLSLQACCVDMKRGLAVHYSQLPTYSWRVMLATIYTLIIVLAHTCLLALFFFLPSHSSLELTDLFLLPLSLAHLISALLQISVFLIVSTFYSVTSSPY